MREDGEHWEAPPRRPARAGAAALAAALVVSAFLLARGAGAPDGAPTVEPTPPRVGPAAREVAVAGVAQPGAWLLLADAPAQARGATVLAWTGACGPHAEPPVCGELLAWGGSDRGEPRASAAAYDVATDAWRPLPDAPRRGGGPVPGVWTGVRPDRPWSAAAGLDGELVLWGATAADRDAAGGLREEPRGVAYSPSSNRWRVLPEAPIAPRTGHSITWNGSEVIVWGGRREPAGAAPELLSDGAAYDPVTNAWRRLPDAPIEARAGHAETAGPDDTVVVFGSFDAAGEALPDGAVYDPRDDAWTAIAPPPVAVVSPRGMFEPAIAWHPDDRLVYVVAPLRRRSRGEIPVLAYDVADRSWSTRDAGPIGLRSGAHAAVTADGRLVVWGGRALRGGALADGGLLAPATGDWQRIPAPPEGLADGAALWLDEQLVVLGAAGAAGWRPVP